MHASLCSECECNSLNVTKTQVAADIGHEKQTKQLGVQ